MKILNCVFVISALFFLQCSNNSSDETPTPTTEKVKISITGQSTSEGSDYLMLSVQLQLDAASDQQITANISTSDGTAESNKDYDPISNQAIVFAPGETEKTYDITIIGDYILEEDEYFEVAIASVVGPATIDNSPARIDILNDDVMGTQDVPVFPTVDWDALLTLTPGSEAPYEVMNFGQPSHIPNAAYTSVAALSDTITFAPSFSPSGDTILYFELTFDPGVDPEDYFADLSELVSVDDSVFVEAKLMVIDNAVNDLEFKYNIWFYIGKTTGERVGPYLIDPKIRIPSQ